MMSYLISSSPTFVCFCRSFFFFSSYSEHFVQFVRRVRAAYPQHTIIAGNVVTGEMVEELILSGADIVKVGIGPGSVCTTRKKTGVGSEEQRDIAGSSHGRINGRCDLSFPLHLRLLLFVLFLFFSYPQLSAVMECADAAHGLGGWIVSDGGCAVPGDLAKAFGGGADFVMLGGMLAGHDESGGQVIEKDGKKSVEFYGMSSATAMNKHAGSVAEYRASEGKTVTVPYRGKVDATILDILGGIRSACTYVGASILKDLSKRTTFIRVTQQTNEIFAGRETQF